MIQQNSRAGRSGRRDIASAQSSRVLLPNVRSLFMQVSEQLPVVQTALVPYCRGA